MAELVKHICFELAMDQEFMKSDELKISFLNGKWIVEICVARPDDDFPFSETDIYLCRQNPAASRTFFSSRTSIIDWNKCEHEVVERESYFGAGISSNNIWNTSTNIVKEYASDFDGGYYRSFLKIEVWLFDKLQKRKSTEISKGVLRCLNEIQFGIESLSCDFNDLLENELHSDVVLIVGDQSIHAHKLILSARSEVFKAMFDHDMQENLKNTVNIKDIDSETFKIFIRYLYTGKFPKLSTETAKDLFVAADKYAVGELKKKCAKVLSSNLSINNACYVLDLADCHSHPELKAAVFDFILKNEEILYTNEWVSFSEERLKLAVEVYRAFAEKHRTKSNAVQK